jgi:hypothetical protein
VLGGKKACLTSYRKDRAAYLASTIISRLWIRSERGNRSGETAPSDRGTWLCAQMTRDHTECRACDRRLAASAQGEPIDTDLKVPITRSNQW